MQHTAKPHSTHNATASQAQPVIIIALIVFAFSGLISGFAYGAFTKPKTSAVVNNNNNKNNENQGPALENTPTPTATPTPSAIELGLGCPINDNLTAEPAADGAMIFTVASQIVDKSIDNKTACGKGKPFYNPKLVCKIWLTKDGKYPIQVSNEIDKASKEDQKALKSFAKPFAKEEPSGLVMEAGSAQVQPCSAEGKTNWKYRLSPSLEPGTYTIVVMASWDATLINWSWFTNTVAKK